MTPTTSHDPVAALLLRLVRPLMPGAVTGDGMVLEAVEGHPSGRLCFLGPGGCRFAIRFMRSRPGAKFFATTGRLDLILDTSGRRSEAVEGFVRKVAVGVGHNLADLGDEQLAILDAPSGVAEDISPALRRRATLAGASLLDINVGDGCNLACTFCTDVDSRGRELFRPTSFWQEELARAHDRGKRGLLISGNEPTLRTDLPEIVSTARRLGFVEIELSTAGVRLADRAYLGELLDAGVNVMAVSIHGSNASVDGAQTGRPDFFEPRRRGFEHFVDLVGDRAAQDSKGVYLKTITIFTRSNLSDLPALVSLLDVHEVSYILLHYPWVKGAAAHQFDEVVPDFASVREAIAPLAARLGQSPVSVAVANLPPCVAPDGMVGRTARKDIVRPSTGDDRGRPPFLRVVSEMDPTLTHAPCCESCALRASCSGLPRRYLERYGEMGLRPLRRTTERILVQVGTELLEALRAADPDMPSALEVFDRVVASGEPRPDFYEYSVRFGERFSPHRLTFYFDVHRRGPQVAHEAGARFVRLAGELGLDVPSALRELVLSDAPSADEVLQVVLGIEAPGGNAGARGKYYLVFRDNPGRCVRELMGALALAPPSGADPDRVYIVGCDVTDAGLDDVKLYFRLDAARVERLLDDPGEVKDLLVASRDVVFQQCSRRPGRRQLYLHARSGTSIERWLTAHGHEEPLGRARAINARLRGLRLEPWIVAFGYDRRRLNLKAGNVYFHLVRAS